MLSPPPPFVLGPPSLYKSEIGEGSAKSSPDILCFTYILIEINLGLLMLANPLFYPEKGPKGGGICMKAINSKLMCDKVVDFFQLSFS